MQTVLFRFTAKTGMGAMIDGSVPGTSAEQVAQDLLRQGLIPVRIWPESELQAPNSLRLISRSIGAFLGKCRALLHV
jgi:type II secretory pathway component PulF